MKPAEIRFNWCLSAAGLVAAVAALLWLVGCTRVAAQGTGVNPPVGSVWTYLGATYGAGWNPLPLGQLSLVPDNNTLKTSVGTPGQVVIRTGFYAPGDGGEAVYIYTASPCSLNGGAGDNGSQVAATAGGCWIANFGTLPVSLSAWGAKCDGATNDAPAIQAAINSNPTGVLWVPARVCRYTSTLSIAAGNIQVLGAGSGVSTLQCRAGAGDCLDIVPPGGINSATRINNITLKGFTIDASGATGGNGLELAAVHDAHIQDLTVYYPFNGVLVWNTNIIVWNDGNIVNPSATYAFKYDMDPTIGRSDGFVLNNVLIGCNFSGADGIVQDGASYSLTISGGAVLNCAHDFHVLNSRNYVGLDILNDQWINCAGDGASVNSVRISAGAIIQVAGCSFDNAPGRTGQGSADGPVVQIDADTGFTPSQSDMFSNNFIASGSQQCLLDNGINNTYTGNTFNNCGGASAYAVLEFGPTSTGSSVCGNYIGDIYSTYKYGIQMDYPAPRPAVCANGNSILQGGNNTNWLGPFGFVGFPAFSPPTPPFSSPVLLGGAQLQVGIGTTDTSGTITVTFGAPFGAGPTINVTPTGGATGACGSPRVNSFVTTGSQVTGFNLAFQNTGTECGFAWSAIGY